MANDTLDMDSFLSQLENTDGYGGASTRSIDTRAIMSRALAQNNRNRQPVQPTYRGSGGGGDEGFDLSPQYAANFRQMINSAGPQAALAHLLARMDSRYGSTNEADVYSVREKLHQNLQRLLRGPQQQRGSSGSWMRLLSGGQ